MAYPCVLPASSSSDGSQLVATIRVSASTNTGEVDVAVYADGSAVRTVGPPRFGDSGALDPSPETYPPGSEPVVMFLCDLAAAGDVSELARRGGVELGQSEWSRGGTRWQACDRAHGAMLSLSARARLL